VNSAVVRMIPRSNFSASPAEWRALEKVVAAAFAPANVLVHADAASMAYFTDAVPIDEDGYGQEYLGPEIAVRVVDTYEDAIQHIARFGSQHTEVICSENEHRTRDFLSRVDASVVMANASSRFSDGSQLGLGAEIGIATTKLHAYGPMGLESLTTEKYLVEGTGQVRE
jgi:glutamate-5-semialdehyde dehydrogenase